MPKEFWVKEPRQIEFREYEEPVLKPGEIRIKSFMSGISHGTELGLYRGSTPFVDNDFDPELRMFRPGKGRLSFPMRLGYEMVGEVVEVGADVKKIKIGDLIHGYFNHRESNVGDQNSVMLLPKDMKTEKSMFFALSVVALIGIHDAQVKIGDEVAIYGLGAIGLIAVQLAKLAGADKVYAIDRLENRCKMAEKLGADVVLNPTKSDVAYELKKMSEKKGADVAIECSGNYNALNDAMRCVRMSGKIVTVGYYQGNATPIQFGAEWHHNRLTLISSMGVWGCPNRDYPLWDYQRMKDTVLKLLYRDRIKTDGFITHKFPFSEIEKAYRLIDKHPEETIKVVITY